MHHHIAQMHGSENVIEILSINREATVVALLEHEIRSLFQRLGTIDRHNVLAVRHNVPCLLITHLKNIGDHLCLSAL